MAGYKIGAGLLVGASALATLFAGAADAGGPIRPDAKVAGERLDEELAESPEPALSFPGYGEELGNDVYGDLGRQSVRFALRPGDRTKVRFRAENDGTQSDTFRMKIVASLVGRNPRPFATVQKVGEFRVKYFRSGINVTEKISDGMLKERNVAPDSHARSIVAKVRALEPADPEARPEPLHLLFAVHSVKDPLTADVAAADIFTGIDR